MNSTPREFAARIGSFFRRHHLDSELDRELASHLDLATDDNLRAGMPPAEARRAALTRTGSPSSAHDEHRDARGLPRLETFLQDVRVALRGFRREPGFALVALLILALGIGANTAVFTVVNTILIRELPFREPARLAWIQPRNADGMSAATYNTGAYEEYRRNSRSFEDITGYFAFFAFGSYKWTGQGEPERLAGVDILPNFIPTLGIRLPYGRNFTAEESSPNGPRALILSHNLWKRRFQSNPNVVGTIISINGTPTTIAGVMPESFDSSSTFSPGTRVDIFQPAIVENMRTWMALVLASLGIYGVVSYSVNQRRREFGIRMALGASAAEVRSQVIRRAVALTLTGIAIGAAVSLFASRLLATLLFGVQPTDLTTFAVMIGTLVNVSLAAAYLPALRASRVHPSEALRAD